MGRSSTAYQFTVTSLDDDQISLLRTRAQIMNLGQRMGEITGQIVPKEYYGSRAHKRFRVVVRGRLGKNSPFKHLYAVGGPLKRYFSQTIRPEHASRFDVYLQPYTRWSKVK